MFIFLGRNVMVLSKTQFTRDRSLTKVLMGYIGSNIRPPGTNSCRVQKISEVCAVTLPVETCPLVAVVNRTRMCRSSERA